MSAARVVLTVLALTLACNDDKGDLDTGATMGTTVSSSNNTPGTSEGTSEGTATSEALTTTSGTPTTTASTGSSDATSDVTTSTTSTTEPDTSSSTTGPVDPCAGEAPRVRLVTNVGDMVLQLDAVRAPVTVANFIQYVEADFYDGTIFHRVIDGFVLQGGGYTQDLQMKPTDPPIPLEVHPELLHVDGAIGMARTMDPNSATSQFYICDGAQPGLDAQYAVFGVLVEGWEVRDAISMVPTDANDMPIDPVILMSANCE